MYYEGNFVQGFISTPFPNLATPQAQTIWVKRWVYLRKYGGRFERLSQ
jgi:hypothetical protein